MPRPSRSRNRVPSRPSAPLPPTSPFLRRGPSLTRPWPLLPIALADISYTLYATVTAANSRNSPGSHLPPSPQSRHQDPETPDAPATVPTAFIALALCRAAAICALNGNGNGRWRQRGGWVLGLAGATLITCTWELCAGTLSRGRERREVEDVFVFVTAGFAMFELLLFLALVRISPPRPFALRPPPGRSPSLPLTPHVTPLPTTRKGTRERPPLAPLFTTPIPQPAPVLSPFDNAASYGATDSVATSVTSFGGPATMRSPTWGWEAPDERDEGEATPNRDSLRRGRGHGSRLRGESVERDPEDQREEGGEGDTSGRWDEYNPDNGYGVDVEAGDFEDGYESDDSASCTSSTVSESSIIDLPRPRPLHPIVLPESTSGALAEIAGAVEAAAGVVRRSASARFGRSAETEAGYGTFAARS